MFGRRGTTCGRRRTAWLVRQVLAPGATAVVVVIGTATVFSPATAGAAEPPGARPATAAAAARPAARLDAFGDPLPPGAVLRLGTIRLRGPNFRSATFAPDGQALWTVQAGGRLQFWDADSGRPTRSVALGPEVASALGSEPAVRFSPDGRLVAAGREGGALFLDPGTLAVVSQRQTDRAGGGTAGDRAAATRVPGDPAIAVSRPTGSGWPWPVRLSRSTTRGAMCH